MPRPKKDKLSREQHASLRRVFVEIANTKPWLLKEAFEKGLASDRPLGFLELAARLMKEIGVNEQTAPQIAIVFNSPLDTNKLKPGFGTVRVIQAPQGQTLPALTSANDDKGYDKEKIELADLSLLEDEG